MSFKILSDRNKWNLTEFTRNESVRISIELNRESRKAQKRKELEAAGKDSWVGRRTLGWTVVGSEVAIRKIIVGSAKAGIGDVVRRGSVDEKVEQLLFGMGRRDEQRQGGD